MLRFCNSPRSNAKALEPTRGPTCLADDKRVGGINVEVYPWEFWRLSCSLAVLWRQTCRAKSRFLRLLPRSVRLRSARLRLANFPSARGRWSHATDTGGIP